VHGGNGRHAQVDLLALDAQLDPAVLREPPLGDVEVRHDLHARDDGGRQAPRRGLDLVQDAVDAEAHDEAVLEGLDVDVGGPRLQRVRDEQVHQPHHGRLGGEVLQVLDVAQVLLLVPRGDVVDDLAHRGLAGAVEALEPRFQLRGHGEARQHAVAARHLDRADGERVRRVGHRHHEALVGLAQRQRLRVAQEAVRDALLEERELGILGGGGHRDPQPLREGVGEVARRNQSQPVQDDAELLARLSLLEAQGALEVGGIEFSAGDEDLAQAAWLALGRKG
jgi:hypothetical protein